MYLWVSIRQVDLCGYILIARSQECDTTDTIRGLNPNICYRATYYGIYVLFTPLLDSKGIMLVYENIRLILPNWVNKRVPLKYEWNLIFTESFVY